VCEIEDDAENRQIDADDVLGMGDDWFIGRALTKGFLLHAIC
jgi:hypothetical protein